MATDFNYGGKLIASGGPFRPTGKDMPCDGRQRVENFADIVEISNPYIGLKITVIADETNNNKMTDYIVKSLKANSMGVANSAINEVVRYVDYLGASSGGNGSSIDLSAYATKSELNDVIKRIDGMESAGNLVLRDISVGEIFIAGDHSSSTTTYGNIVLSKSSVTIVEGGSDTFTIKLDKLPSQNQQVSLSVDNSSVILSKTIFEFTPSNFNVEQSVTITISEDDNYANEIATLTATSSNVPSKTLTINITDNDEQSTSLITDGLVSYYDMTRELSNGKIKDLHGGLDITLDTNYVVYENGYIATIDGGIITNYVTSAVAPANTITNAYSVIVTFTLGTTNVHPICSTGLRNVSQLLVYAGGLINYGGAFNQSQSATQIRENTKYTVALTYSVGGNDTIYINGVKKYSEVTKVPTVGNQLRLFSEYGAKHTATKIHNLALYDRVLTDEEVASVTLYLGGK